MADMEVTLLGGFEARLSSGEVRDLPGQKDRGLLAILALPPGTPHSRDKLAGLLWSDRGDRQARDSLKHALARLRKFLQPAGAAPIIADRQTVRLDPTGLAIDAAAFERFVKAGDPASVERALDLFRGDLLDGIPVRDKAFEDWVLVERQRLRDLAEEAATGLLRHSMAAGDSGRAVAAARRLLALDPLREEACRALMQMHADRGEAAQALKLYEALSERLHRELGVKPEPETVRLFEAIRNRPGAPGPTAVEPDGMAGDAPASTGPPLPDKPSIAVLAFENLSGDPEQEYFADGIVEEIITALSRMRWLFVIARNSSFAYKGRAVDVKEIGRELGVRYILEGSVRKAANRVRITGRLIAAATGVQLWGDGFEGRMEDIFELQDQVTANVVGALAPRLEEAEIERAKRKPTADLDAYDYFLRGMSAFHQWTREANIEALRMFAKAIERDGDFAAAYGVAARCYSQRKACGWVTDREGDIAEVRRLAARAAETGADDAVALCTAGIGLAFVPGDVEDGAALIERALALNPNLASAWLFSGWVNVWLGRPDVAIEHLSRAMRLSPHDPQFAMMQAATACAHFIAGRNAEASPWAERAVHLQPNYMIASCVLAANRAASGQLDAARREVERLRRIDPRLRISNLLDSYPFRRQEDFEKWADGLRKAGLSE